MTVLYILGALLVIAIIFALIEKINAFSESKYNYEFFSWGNLAFTAFGYAFIYFGRNWYLADLVAKNGDTLNGVVLMAIGTLMILGLLISHINNTNFVFGFTVGLIQLILYIPAAVAGIFALLIMMAWLSDTKPVINLN